MTENKVIQFPANRIVRHDPTNQPASKYTNREQEAIRDAKKVFDNLRFELFEQYKLYEDKDAKMNLPYIEDIIKLMFIRNYTATPPEDEPPPLRYA